jgi:hypothetical protein
MLEVSFGNGRWPRPKNKTSTVEVSCEVHSMEQNHSIEHKHQTGLACLIEFQDLMRWVHVFSRFGFVYLVVLGSRAISN